MKRPVPRNVRIYEVGGAVRDTLLGRPVSDRDWVVVGATPEMMMASGYQPVGSDFPVFLHPDTHEEYALARTERKHGTGYRGFEFFASPDVTLEEDLARRDLTINAIARDPDGTIIDPFNGRDDLARGVLRHVSPAFAEDPLRVLRVARFAARFGFAVDAATLALMRDIAASGELATLAPERLWRELATGLMEAAPSRLVEVLRACGALAAVLPEVDRAYAVAAPAGARLASAGAAIAAALDHAASRGFELAVRYAVLAQARGAAAAAHPARGGPLRAAVRGAERLSARLKVPIDCRDAASLAARYARDVENFAALRPSRILDLVIGCDALRRPQRLRWVAEVAESLACAGAAAPCDFAQRDAAMAARDCVAAVDAGALARDARDATSKAPEGSDNVMPVNDAIRVAIRRARLVALRSMKRGARAGDPGRDGDQIR